MPLRHVSQTLHNALHAPDWRRQWRWRRGLWHTFARLGLTGIHAAPVHRKWLDVTRHRMPLAGLDRSLEALKVVQISDLHISPLVWKGFIAEQLRHVGDLRPDLLVVTGDLITGGYRYMSIAADLLAEIDPRPPLGVVCTLGNHDYSSLARTNRREADRRAAQIGKVLEQRGLKLLRNQSLRVTPPGAAGQLTLVGLDDLWTGRLDARAAFDGVAEDEPVICLNHDPRNALDLVEFPWQWMLAGHTHGRQLATSFVGRRFNRRRHRNFVRGRYELPGGKSLYVNRGLSYGQRSQTWCKPEISLFRLTAARAGSQQAPEQSQGSGDVASNGSGG